MSSNPECRDATVRVDVELPNGTLVSGRIIPWRKAMALILKADEFTRKGGSPDKTIVPVFEEFSQLTGVTFEQLEALCPDLTLGEIVDVMNRFFYALRPGPTVGAGTVTSAPAAIAPSPAPTPATS